MILQAILGAIAFSILIIKLKLEKHKRDIKIFVLDASK